MSSSTCISSNPIYKPKANSRFSKPMESGGVTVVDSKSCRQLYLRTAYTFSRPDENKESYGNIEKAKKCLSRVKDRVTLVCKRDYDDKSYKVMIRNNKGSSLVIFRKVKEFSYASFLSMIRRMLSCTAKVDVSEH
ncbi:uncharacterized protein LOC110684135 [Chenopodium quinoa]|uniref:Uncharacterized protein n=1 Tax=Chenopodium quinoa TaxID=63459 RepID=A0A803LCQ3_CHEQI|nr:uncharacterized protein LOC110684135 [Chenopodium quinoa]